MDPNNAQQSNVQQPSQQPVDAPVQPEAPSFAPPPVSAPETPQAPIPQMRKSGNKKGIILMLILVTLALGMAFYVVFVKSRAGNVQKSANESTSIILPTSAATPTESPATIDQINVGSPDADIKEIETDVQGL